MPCLDMQYSLQERVQSLASRSREYRSALPKIDQTLAEAVEEAEANAVPIDDRYPAPDAPVGKGQLGSLLNAIS